MGIIGFVLGLLTFAMPIIIIVVIIFAGWRVIKAIKDIFH